MKAIELWIKVYWCLDWDFHIPHWFLDKPKNVEMTMWCIQGYVCYCMANPECKYERDSTTSCNFVPIIFLSATWNHSNGTRNTFWSCKGFHILSIYHHTLQEIFSLFCPGVLTQCLNSTPTTSSGNVLWFSAWFVRQTKVIELGMLSLEI